jgi:hypothetical protein
MFISSHKSDSKMPLKSDDIRKKFRIRSSTCSFIDSNYILIRGNQCSAAFPFGLDGAKISLALAVSGDDHAERRRAKTAKQASKDPLIKARDQLKRYDAGDLVRAIAALQLYPRNSDQYIRLESLAHAAASLPFEPGKPAINQPRLKTLCNTDPFGEGWIAAAEDPSTNLFTEAFTFFGGSYIVFPGLVSEATFILRNISKGLFLCADAFPDPRLSGRARRLFTALLGSVIKRRSEQG